MILINEQIKNIVELQARRREETFKEHGGGLTLLRSLFVLKTLQLDHGAQASFGTLYQ